MKNYYWLKGGIISIILAIVAILFSYFLKFLTIDLDPVFNCVMAPCNGPDFVIRFFSIYITNSNMLSFAIIFPISVFILGACIGLVYGTIRKPKADPELLTYLR
jgi:hypothetical protein